MSADTVPQLNLRRKQIAHALNVPISVVDGLVRTGELPSFMIGGTRLARFEDVEAFNDARAAGSAPEPVA